MAVNYSDNSKKKRKRNPDEEVEVDIEDEVKKSKLNQIDEAAKGSDWICTTHNLVNVDIDIPDELLSDMTYKQFNKHVRSKVQESNPKASGLHITSLVGAKWREFKELYGIEFRSDTPDIERLKGTFLGSPLSEPELKESHAGDRKTSRQVKKTARQGIVNLDEINLDEVTRAEQEEETEKKKHKKRTGPRIKNTKDKKEKKKAQKVAGIVKKSSSIKKAVKGETLPEPIHNSVCDVCGEGGDILLCDTCTCVWHLTCLDPPLDEVPEGDWSCPKCEDELSGPVEEDEDDENFHGDYCKICRDGGELLCCDFCPGTYHMRCVKPQLITVPEGEWKCPLCKVDKLPGKVERILFWKFLTHTPTKEEIAAGAKDEQYKVRKFFVKYANMSYWNCHWIDELQLEKYHISLFRFFCRKNDMNDPPMTEEGTVEEGEDVNVDEVEHKRNLDGRFFQYGIKPEWLQIHRILWHKEVKKKIQYLVKWRELGYEMSTWEFKDDECNKDIDDFDKYIEIYNNLRAQYKKKLKKKDKVKSSKKREGWEYDIRPNGYSYTNQPSFITDTGGILHEYQIEGINWIRYSWAQRDNTILADEMGLGKTIQTITFLNSLLSEGRSEGPFLICAPLSTIVNWEREFEFWAPNMYVVTYSGNRENRQVIRNYEMTFDDDSMRKGQKAYKVKKDVICKFHVLLTSYELVAIDANTLQSIDWKVLVIDEAHRLKNNQSRFFRTMTSYNIDYTLLLTGTPLQNNLEELFHLLNFLCPDKFQNRENFLAEFEDIAKEDQIKKLHEMLGPHMLRRLKGDVLKDMPSKSEFIVRVELSPMQKKYYKYILTKNFGALNTRGSQQVSLLNIVMELKKCCNHPYLFSTASLEAPRYANNAYEVKGLTEASGKLVLLYKMLKKLKEQGHRVLIFSQMTRVLDLLEDFMEGHGWRYERLDGTITGGIRQSAIDRFNLPNSEIFSFLLSTRAGGLGINLATADTVFIYDSDWNPHNDIQAFSRAHRIGQQNKVMIYRFVTKSTVEERITQVAKKKMMLTHLVVRPGLGSKAAQSMSKRELDDILKFGTEEMFKDDGDDSTGRIVYDDNAINMLLDRSNEGIMEKESGMDDYLSSFKVASYTVKDKDEPDVEVLKQEADTIDADYWEKLLRHHYEQEQEYVASTLGKGKRIRKQVNYNDGALTAETKMLRQAYDDGSDFDASELVDESSDLSDEDLGSQARQKKLKEKDILPPLLAKVGSQLEVYGFNPRQRRAFLTAVMRYGLPPKDFALAKDKWCIHNLRGKSEKCFQAYTSMFLRHLCEPGMDTKSETYSDGVPREGVNRLQLLSRIGIMSLIKRKVEEYSSINTFLHTTLYGHVSLHIRSNEDVGLNGDLEKDSKSSVEKAAVDETSNNETTDYNIEEESSNKVKSLHIESANTDSYEKSNEKEKEKLNIDKHLQNDKKVLAGDSDLLRSSAKDSPTEKGESELVSPQAIPKFMFNIADGGFTELHVLWEAEEKRKLDNIWWRFHDYWLLAGVVVHGYSRWQDIQNDEKFETINKPFARMSIDYKNKFIARRFKLLEQALIVEEQLKRATLMSVTQDNKHPAMSLQSRFAELECLAESHQHLSKESLSGNKPANAVLHKVLNQLESLLSEMKNDVARLPTSLAKMPPVTHRLAMSERSVLTRLATGGQLPIPGQVPFPSSGLVDRSALSPHGLGVSKTYPSHRSDYTPI
ncbi:chromodomain-helicase-DNA-binding protein 3 isoform X8 [Hydra vulgaris]|uniref:Chromodomain-helicase-DNA-binding protein 3 isoform X8 n=1 Tax=Hydra vulgaris TaxID=6087 RepID=A0ABM4C429_HYDVU